jgi:hypothetical protein
MNRRAFCAIGCLVCLAMASIAGGQQNSGVPAEVCQAIEKFVATVNTSGAVKDKKERQKQYSVALESLAAVIKRYGSDNLLQQAREFVEYTELIADTDPTDPRFSDFLAKRIKSGGNLQSLCMPYTTSR